MFLTIDLVFVALVVALAATLAWRRRRVAVGLGLWLAVLAALAWQGFFQQWGALPPRVLLVLLLPLAAGLAMLPTRAAREFLVVIPPARLVYVQSFRVLMELILWVLAVQGRVPWLLTFEGRNVDILVGVTAVPVAYFAVARQRWPPAVATTWNVAGIVILLNVVIHALLSAPTPLRALTTEPATTFVATVPYIWLPGFLVPLALWLHAASLLQITRLRRARRAMRSAPTLAM